MLHSHVYLLLFVLFLIAPLETQTITIPSNLCITFQGILLQSGSMMWDSIQGQRYHSPNIAVA